MPQCACLLIHGFSGSPFEMLPVAEALEAQGYRCSLPTLPGHASTVQEWRRSGWTDWLAYVSREYERLEAAHGAVALLGLSMGGSLCLALAQKYRPACVVVMAAPVYLYRFLPPEALDWRLPLTGILKKIRPVWPVTKTSGPSRLIAPWQGYDEAVALEPLHSFLCALPDLRRGLSRITAPLLAMHAPGDRSVPYGNLWEITRKVASRRRQGVTLAIRESVTKHHLLTTHVETRGEVARLCAAFVHTCCG